MCNAVVLAALACLPAESALQLYGFNWSPGHWPRHDVAAEARAIAGLQTAGLLRVHPTPCHGAQPAWLLLLLLQLVPVRRFGLVHNVWQCHSWTNTLTACGRTRIATQGVLKVTFADILRRLASSLSTFTILILLYRMSIRPLFMLRLRACTRKLDINCKASRATLAVRAPVP